METRRYEELLAGVNNKNLEKELRKCNLSEVEDLIIKREKPIYRFNIHFDNFRGNSFEEMTDFSKQQATNGLVQELKKVANPPNHIWIFKDEYSSFRISCSWFPPYPLNFTREEDYLTALDNFQNYIDSFDFADGRINIGQFGDDPATFTAEEEFYNGVLGIKVKTKAVKCSKEKLKEGSFEIEKDVKIY